jgi:hypothetical protein
VPACDFRGELFFSSGGELVKTRSATGIFWGPLSSDPARLFHAVKRGIERADLGVENVTGGLPDGRQDGITVQLNRAALADGRGSSGREGRESPAMHPFSSY